jgi:voltage-gated potassium channel
MNTHSSGTAERSRRSRIREIIFEAETPAGKAFDVVLIVLILLSVAAVTLESLATVRVRFGPELRAAEWFFTIVFTVEYGLRLWCVDRRWRYATSFFGIVDLLAILPTYLSVLFPGGQALASVRALRLLRVFRVLKLAHHVSAASELMRAMRASRRKITVFLMAVLTLVTILGSTMYVVEGPRSGFTSIPRGIYWAIVTLTTVGYGDITPVTTLGQLVAALVMIMGYGIIAVPTGIVTAELTAGRVKSVSTEVCPGCHREGHDADATHCKFCGEGLNPP